MKLYLFFTLSLIVLIQITSFTQNKDEQSIRRLLSNQTNAWNTGNLDKFMVGYWNDDSLVFIGKKGLKYGYNTTLENYRKSYPDTSAMGKLDFTLLQIKRLSNQYYYVIGKWHLQRTVGDLEGYFDLLFKKIKNKWVIVADHSS